MQKLLDNIIGTIRKRKYYEINEFDIDKVEEGKLLLLEKYIKDHGLYVRVENLNEYWSERKYANKMRLNDVRVIAVCDFDIHTLPADRFMLKKEGSAVIVKVH